MNVKEKCKNCKFCAKLYVPPHPDFKRIPKNKYVCTLFLKSDDQVMYLQSDELMCEMFTPKSIK